MEQSDAPSSRNAFSAQAFAQTPNDTPEPSDEALYEQFLQGDTDALEALIARYKDSLTLFLYGYIQDRSDAEQLMIEAFAQLVASEGQFASRSSLKTYLFTIGRHEALRYLKKNPPHLSLESLSPQALAQDDILQTLQRLQENQQQLYTAMTHLPANYRQVLFLLYFEGLHYQEAAQVMCKSIKQITNLAYRAKKALKATLEQEGFVYDA